MKDKNLTNIAHKAHFWRYVHAFMGTIAVVVGLIYLFFGDADKTARVWHNIQGLFASQPPSSQSAAPAPSATPAITTTQLTLSTGKGTYHAGERFDYHFASTQKGYVSLWNISAGGRAQRIVPLATNHRAQRVIGKQNYAAGDSGLPAFSVSGAAGLEQLLLLWCPRQDDHGFSALFPRLERFEQDLEKRRSSGCIEQRSSYRILPGTNPGPGTNSAGN